MDQNPYQAPATNAQADPVREDCDLSQLTEPAYKDGGDLLFRKDFVSPHICLQTGEPLANTAKPFKMPLLGFMMNKHPLWKVIYYGIMISLLYFMLLHSEEPNPLLVFPFLALAFMQAKYCGHTSFYYAKKVTSGQIKMALIFSLLFMMPAIFLFIYGKKHFESHGYLLGIPFLILYWISITRSSPIRTITKQGDYYRLRGCHPNFLVNLPSASKLQTDDGVRTN